MPSPMHSRRSASSTSSCRRPRSGCGALSRKRSRYTRPMSKLQLVIGDKNYSSWSMRPWVLLRQAQIPFDEVQLSFSEDNRGLTVVGIDKYSKARKVPVLMVDG